MIGLKIGNFHTYDDFKLKMLSFESSDPEVRTVLQEVPGRNGALDLSESLNGEPVYENRKLVAEFDMEEANPEMAKVRLRQIRNCIHGMYLQIIDDKEPEYYYEGRVSVSCKRKNYLFYLITITVDAQPFKLRHEETTVIANVDGETTVVCSNERMSVVPTIISDAEMNLVFNDSSFSIGVGTYLLPDMKFVQGENVVNVQNVISNLIPYPYYETTHTQSGITYTDNGDKTITIDGTATANSFFGCRMNSETDSALWLEPGTYELSGCPEGGSSSTYDLEVYLVEDTTSKNRLALDIGEGASFTLTERTKVLIQIRITSGTTIENLTFKPFLGRKDSTIIFKYQEGAL